MKRLLKAFVNSVRALRRLAVGEPAVRQELVLLALSLPIGWFLATSWRGFALLIGSMLFLLLVEVLNTAVEAACDAISPEFDRNIQLAKDCGSLAVLISILLVAAVWLLAVAERFWGLPL